MTFGNRKEDFDPQSASHTETTEAVERLVEYVAEVCDSVEFLHGVPVKLSSETKALLRGRIRKALTTIRKETLEETLDISWDWIVEATHKGEWGREDYKQYVRDRLQALKK